MQPKPTPTSSSQSNRGSRRHPHLEHSSALQDPYRQASPTAFPQPDHLSTDQYDFPAPPFQRQRAISSYALDSAALAFPEPQLYRSGSSKATYRPLTPTNQDFRNDLRISARPSPTLQPALPPAIPPRNFVASPQADDKKVTFRSFNPTLPIQPLTQHVVSEIPPDFSKLRYQLVLTPMCMWVNMKHG